MLWTCKNGTDLLYHHAQYIYGGAGTSSPAGAGAKRVGVFVVNHAFKKCIEVVLTTSSSRRVNIKTTLLILFDTGRFVTCAPAFNFVSVSLVRGVTTQC